VTVPQVRRSSRGGLWLENWQLLLAPRRGPRVIANAARVSGHLRDEIYEVRAESERRSFRLLFAKETKFILLSLHGFREEDAEDARRRARGGRAQAQGLAESRRLIALAL
jgi:hypothetical protein